MVEKEVQLSKNQVGSTLITPPPAPSEQQISINRISLNLQSGSTSLKQKILDIFKSPQTQQPLSSPLQLPSGSTTLSNQNNNSNQNTNVPQNSAQDRDIGKNELTITELITYNLMFLVPIGIALFLSNVIGKRLSQVLQASPGVISDIIMIPFTIAIFAINVPFIRNRENIKGVRYALFGFLIVAISMTLPAMFVRNDFSLLLNNLLYLAGYILITFIYCPEVLGIEGDLRTWFRQNKQLFVILVYSTILLCYIFGFAQIYYEIGTDKAQPKAFIYGTDIKPTYGTFLYYSTVTFMTIGYGDITPFSPAARFAFIFQAFIGNIFATMFLSILLLYVSNSQAWSQSEEEKKMQQEEEKVHEEEE
ncbi:two pore domain potassium channel family protein, partial [Candidatus Woesearchaeota archaeon]|nr:two pore domain potassium channel family protein [Candidatus Woesearchaeota archaeon]